MKKLVVGGKHRVGVNESRLVLNIMTWIGMDRAPINEPTNQRLMILLLFFLNVLNFDKWLIDW